MDGERVPKELGPYRLDVRLGRGGMGEVYKAWDRRLLRWVAVKRLVTDDPASRSRFRREAQAAAQIQHPSVVQIFDILEEDGDDWIVMELVHGTDLASILRQGPLDVEMAVDCAVQVASGLAALHEKGIVHRDLKTENVMVTSLAASPASSDRTLDGRPRRGRPDPAPPERPERWRVKLLDFGLAKGGDLGRGDSALTLSGHILGTPRAMSPEQARGREVNFRSDLFSLGVLLYEALTGRSPFSAGTIAETLSRLLNHHPSSVRQSNLRVPRTLSDLVDALLDKDPLRRPGGAAEVMAALECIGRSLEGGEVLSDDVPTQDLTARRQDTSSPRDVWCVPHRRNPFFTGRKDVLAQIHRALSEERGSAAGRAITGLGGIGKTQTAVEYCYQHRDDYSAVLWVRAETEAELRSGLASIAARLGLPEAEAQDVAVEAVRRWLEEHSGWLFVFDNADRPEVLRGVLPQDPRGTILLTSRAQRFGALGIRKPLRIQPLPNAEAETLLIERAGRDVELEEERRAVADLAEELGCLPLALEQAGAYVEATQTRFQSYLADYRKRQLEVVEKARPETGDYRESVATTWSMAFGEVEKASAASVRLLEALSFLAPDAVPLELFEEAFEELGPTLAAAFGGGSELAVSEALEPLLRFSLVERDVEGRTVSVHRMVQAVVRSGLGDEARRRWAGRLLKALARVFPYPEPKSWPRCERLYGQALAAAGLVEKHSIEGFEATSLLSSAGTYALKRVRYAEAERLFLRSREIRERTLPGDHPAVADSMQDLAQLYRDQGHPEKAEPLFCETLALREKTLGKNDPAVADSLASLGGLYYIQGRYDEAEPLLLRSLRIREEVLGADHPDVADSLNGLAILYRPQGRFDEAEPLHRRALEIREKAFGDEPHPDVAHSLTNLAALYRDQGRFEEAEPLDRRSLEIREKVLGADHPGVTYALTNLAALQRELGRYEEAERLALRALAIREKALGVDDPGIAPCLSTLAAVYGEQGRHDEAEPLFLRSLAIQEKSLGPDHPGVAYATLGLARLYELEGKPAESEKLFQRSLQLRSKALGQDHPLTRKARGAYEDFLRGSGRADEADALRHG